MEARSRSGRTSGDVLAHWIDSVQTMFGSTFASEGSANRTLFKGDREEENVGPWAARGGIKLLLERGFGDA